MKKLMLALACSLSVCLLPATAEAVDACFDYVCDEQTNECQFDAACSSGQPWKYDWDFGDGTQTGLTGDSDPVHQYDPICYPQVTLKFHTFDGSDEVSCFIHTGYPGCPGPPVAGPDGRCT